MTSQRRAQAASKLGKRSTKTTYTKDRWRLVGPNRRWFKKAKDYQRKEQPVVLEDLTQRSKCECWLMERVYDHLVHFITTADGVKPKVDAHVLCGAPVYDAKVDKKRLMTPYTKEKRADKGKSDPTCDICINLAAALTSTEREKLW